MRDERGVRLLAAWLGRTAGQVWSRLSLISLAAFVLLAAATIGFVGLADTVLEGETRRVDAAVLRAIAGLRADWLDVVALEVTALANTTTLVVVSLVAAVLLWIAGRRISVTLLLVSLLSGVGVMHALKVLFGRPRPDLVAAIANVETAAFPSGHAMMGAITYGTVAYLVGRIADAPLRHATWTGAALLVVLIGLSRIYVGVHYPTDVLAGWLAGIGWTALLVGIFHLLGGFARETPEVERVEAGASER